MSFFYIRIWHNFILFTFFVKSFSTTIKGYTKVLSQIDKLRIVRTFKMLVTRHKEINDNQSINQGLLGRLYSH